MGGVSFLLMFMMYREGEWRGKECVLRGGNGMDGMELGKGGWIGKEDIPQKQDTFLAWLDQSTR